MFGAPQIVLEENFSKGGNLFWVGLSKNCLSVHYRDVFFVVVEVSVGSVRPGSAQPKWTCTSRFLVLVFAKFS